MRNIMKFISILSVLSITILSADTIGNNHNQKRIKMLKPNDTVEFTNYFCENHILYKKMRLSKNVAVYPVYNPQTNHPYHCLPKYSKILITE